jgi:hypothetical protein
MLPERGNKKPDSRVVSDSRSVVLDQKARSFYTDGKTYF